MKHFLTLICISFLLQNCKAQKSVVLDTSTNDNTLLWEVSGNGLAKPSYLFGTFHIMCKDDITFSKNLKTALKSTKEVFFEMDLDDAANTLGGIFFMNMKDTTLKDLYTEAEYEKVRAYFKDSVNTDIRFLNKMKPLMLEAFLYPKMMACKNSSGVEMELMKIAQKEKININGFETIAFQASMFDSIPYRVQANELLKQIDSMANAKLMLDSMVMMYKNQEIESIQKLMHTESFGEAGNNDLLLKNRNVNWVAQIKELLAKENIFVAVGAAHLFDEYGLIALLRKEGYTVRGINNK
jgi:uncharacterized protein